MFLPDLVQPLQGWRWASQTLTPGALSRPWATLCNAFGVEVRCIPRSARRSLHARRHLAKRNAVSVTEVCQLIDALADEARSAGHLTGYRPTSWPRAGVQSLLLVAKRRAGRASDHLRSLGLPTQPAVPAIRAARPGDSAGDPAQVSGSGLPSLASARAAQPGCQTLRRNSGHEPRGAAGPQPKRATARSRIDARNQPIGG